MQISINTPVLFQANFGAIWGGQLGNVGQTLKNPEGTIYHARSQNNIVDEGQGYYSVVLTFFEPWTGYIEWDIDGTGVTAREDITAVAEGTLTHPTLGPSSLTYAYKVGLKHQIVEAMKKAFGATLPDDRYRNIYVGLEYPLEQVRFPAIYITYSEGPIRSVGVGHHDFVVDDNGITQQIKHFYFEGQVNFNVVALNPIDRDNLSAILLNLLAMGRDIPAFEDFFTQIENEKFISLRLMSDTITPAGEQVGNTPWGSEDERVYSNTYSVPVFGEFWSDATTGELIEIDNIVLYPYEYGNPAPW